MWCFVLCVACTADVLDKAAPCSVVNYLRWDLSAQQIAELTAELMEQTKCVYDQVGSLKFEDVSYESTLKALADVEVSYTGKSRSGSRQGAAGPLPWGGATHSLGWRWIRGADKGKGTRQVWPVPMSALLPSATWDDPSSQARHLRAQRGPQHPSQSRLRCLP